MINRFDDWETCSASAFNVVLYTGNYFAAYSIDWGNKFVAIDVAGLCQKHGQSICCDQVVIYIPQINQFAWIIQTVEGNYILSVASPEEIQNSGGTEWTSWLIPATSFGGGGARFDYPEVAVGHSFLYLTCNLNTYSIGVRISIAELFARRTLHLPYFAANNIPSALANANFFMRPVQNLDVTGYFVAWNTASSLRVFSWPEQDDTVSLFDINIASIPTDDFAVQNPDFSAQNPNDTTTIWLNSTSKIDASIRGATLSRSKLWVAWTGARKYSGQSVNVFPYPHIGIAIVNVGSMSLDYQRYIWNSKYAFAWPSLATNINGDVGLSCCWGGNILYPQYGVATLTGPNQDFLVQTSGKTSGAGGHYTSVRESFPNVDTFCGSGFNQVKVQEASGTTDLINHPHYVLFKTTPPIITATAAGDVLPNRRFIINVSGEGFLPGSVIIQIHRGDPSGRVFISGRAVADSGGRFTWQRQSRDVRCGEQLGATASGGGVTIAATFNVICPENAPGA